MKAGRVGEPNDHEPTGSSLKHPGGGGGGDRLSGGSGRDTFVFAGAHVSGPGAEDHILDFDAADDFIDLSGLDADLLAEGRQALTWADDFSGVAGQARLAWNPSEGVTRFEMDRDGDGRADFAFVIEGQATSAAGWIL